MSPARIDNPEGLTGRGRPGGWRGAMISARRAVARTRRPAITAAIRRTPLSDTWGYDRGTPVDRYYIRAFLEAHRSDIRGRTLEVMDTHYSQQLGAGVTTRSVLDIDPGNPAADIVCDLGVADSLPPAAFDCFIITQTLQLVPEIATAIANGHRCLRPGGVMLATIPAMSRLHGSPERAIDHWRVTAAGAAHLFGTIFGPDAVTVESFGNSRTCIAFIAGMAGEELPARELDRRDPRFPLVVGIRAVRQG